MLAERRFWQGQMDGVWCLVLCERQSGVYTPVPSAFFDSLPSETDRVRACGQNWVATWKATGDAFCRLADLNIKKRALDEAREAWLCALFEVARRLRC